MPASLLMARIGRRAGFSIGACFGIVGTSVATLAVFQGSFWLFCLGTALNGVHNGFAMFYRFAAVDGAGKEWHGKAISYVLAGGVLAALVGPELAKHTKDLFAPVIFAGSFASLILVALTSLTVLQFIRIPKPSEAERREVQRPLSVIVAPAGLRGRRAGRHGRLRRHEFRDDGDAAGNARLRPHLRIDRLRDPVARRRHVRPVVLHRASDQALGLPNVMTAGAALLAVCVAINLSGETVAEFLGRAGSARARLELPVRQRHDPVDLHIPAGGEGQGPGA